MTATVATGRGNWLKRVWARLPQGRCLSEGELDEQLLEITGNHPGDFAYAAAVRSALVASRCVTVRQLAGSGRPQYEYERSDWTDWPDSGVGSEAYNAQLQRDHEQREAELRRQDEQRAREFASSPMGQQHQQILDLVDRRVDERVREWLTSLDGDSVARMRGRLMNGSAKAEPVTDDGRDAGREGRTNE